jgi:hypothetical protein
VWSEDEDGEMQMGVVVSGSVELKSTESEPAGENGEESKGSATALSGVTPALSPDTTSTEQTTATTFVEQPPNLTANLTAKHPDDSEIQQSLGALAIKI